MPFYSSPEEQAEYLSRVYADKITRADLAYGFGCHVHNEDSVLQKLRIIMMSRLVDKIGILGRDVYITKQNQIGYSGEKQWRRKLDLDSRDVVNIPAPEPESGVYHTMLESLDLIKFIKSQNFDSLIVIAFPAHLPRVFASIVTAARHMDWNGKIYASCGTSLPWLERVTHSHGTGAITRVESVREEQRRLDAYCESGKPTPLLRARELLDYLNARDLSVILESKSDNLT